MENADVNGPKVLAAVAILVLACFWAIVLIEYLQTIGYIIVLVTPFVTLLAIGAYGIVDGLGVGSAREAGGQIRNTGRVGALGKAVLKLLAEGKSKQEIADATAVSVSVIEEKIEALTKAGFLKGNALSEKGFDLVSEST